MNIRAVQIAWSKAWVILAAVIVAVLIGSVGRVMADDGNARNDQRMVTIYDRGVEQTIITRASTVGEALAQAHVQLDSADIVEPGVKAELVADHYNVNVYRARPVIVEDGQTRVRTVTAAQSPTKIAESAHVTLYPEDKTETARVDDVIAEGGAGLKLTIDRATPFTFVLYGKTLTDTRTQATTVGDMLKEKGIKLGKDDGVSTSVSTPIVAGMTVQVWRNGVQTVTQEEEIAMPIEQVKDQDHEIGYKQVQTVGKPGKKQVTYEIDMRDGREISRKIIQEVQTAAPQKQVEVIGAKSKGGTPAENRVLGHQMMLAAGFGEDQWSCLDALWTRESGWDHHKSNYAGSGAYGIPQALPGSKMGAGWQDDPSVQIAWGLNYIKGRYGTPCGADGYQRSKGWY